MNTVKSSIATSNEQLSQVQDPSRLTVSNNTISLTANSSDSVIALASSEGTRGISWNWWGVEVWLTKTDANAIIKAGIAGGTTYLGSLLGIGGAVAGAIVGTILNEYVNSPPLYVKYVWGNNPIIYPQ